VTSKAILKYEYNFGTISEDLSEAGENMDWDYLDLVAAANK
jgi:hypothetical protein